MLNIRLFSVYSAHTCGRTVELCELYFIVSIYDSIKLMSPVLALALVNWAGWNLSASHWGMNYKDNDEPSLSLSPF